MWVVLIVSFLYIFTTSVEARSGCCSHHGGVCGCGCCDGTSLSSTCAPYYPECNRTSQPVVIKTYPTNTPRPLLPIATKKLLPTNTTAPTLVPTTANEISPTRVPTQTSFQTREPTSNPVVLGSTDNKNDDGDFGGGAVFGVILSGIGYWIYKKIKSFKK